MADHRLQIVLSGKDASQKAFRSVTGRIKGLTKSVFNMRNAMVGAAGVAGMGYMINRQIDLADRVAKTADSIGISTDALQEYRYIAERSGVETSRLDAGLQTFTKRLGELRSGTGALNTMLNKNNQELAEQIKQAETSDEALQIYFNALKDVENQSDRNALAAAAFSKTNGAAMVNMVDDIDTLRDRYERLGIEIEEDLLRQSEDARDSIDDLSAVISSSFSRAVLQLAPDIGQAADRMADWVTENDELITQDLPETMGKIAVGVGKVTKKIVGMGEAAAEKYDTVIGFFDAVRDRIPTVDVPQDVLDLAEGKAIHKASVELTGVNKKTDEAEKSTKGLAAAYQILNREMKVTGERTDDVDIIPSQASRPSGQQDIISPDMIDRSKRLYEETRTPLENLKSDVAEYTELANRGMIDQQTYIRAVEQAYGRLGDEVKETADESEQTFSFMDEFSRMTARNMQSNFSDFFYDSMTGRLDDLEDYFQSFGKTALRVLSDVMAKQVAVQAFGESGTGGAIGSWASTLFHEGGIVGKGGESKSVPASTFAGAPRFHNGLAPDEYPAILQRGEGVFTRDQMKALGGQGQAPNVQVNIIDNTDEKKEASKQDPKWDGDRWVINVVLDAANRNKNGFAKSMKAAMGKA